MELKKDRWYVTWFFLSLAILDKFWGRRDSYKSREWKYEGGTNLCHFMRVTLVWAPLVVLLHLAIYGTAIAVLTIVPMRMLGWSGYRPILVAIGCLLLAFVGVVLILIFLAWLKDFIGDQLYEADLRWRDKGYSESSEAKPARANRGPSFIQIWIAHLKAVKQGICPSISFKQ